MHSLNAELRRREEFRKPMEIGSHWRGGAAIILPEVRIGSRAAIGAGSAVTRDIPERVLAAGNPCRVICEITDEALSAQRSLYLSAGHHSFARR
jgi:maltose O-acetyltransferase